MASVTIMRYAQHQLTPTHIYSQPILTSHDSVHDFAFQVAEEEFKIEARLHYKDFDAWSPWVSSDSPVKSCLQIFLFVSHLFLFNKLLHCAFSEARGLGQWDGLPPGDHSGGGGGVRLAHHPHRHRRPEAKEDTEEVRYGEGWRKYRWKQAP